MESTKILHLSDVIELSEIAEEAVEAVCRNDVEEDGTVAGGLWTREAGERELKRLRSERDPLFTVQNGMWMGRSVHDHVMEETAADFRDQYFCQKPQKIRNLMSGIAKWQDGVFGDDITDACLLSLFSVAWYRMLQRMDEIADWNKAHHIPARVPGGEQLWYVDLGDDIEIGPLEYVASEYCRSGLFFSFEDGPRDEMDPAPHEHSFEEVLRAALDAPETFNIEGHEDCYSEQERQFLMAFVEKLKADRKENFPQKV